MRTAPFVVLLAGITAFAGLPLAVRAQASPLVLEIQGGAAAPVGSFREAEPGSSFGVKFVSSGEGRRATYGGFSQHRFGCEELGCPVDGEYVATGFDVGFRIDLRTSGSVIPWLRVGAVTMQVEAPAPVVPDGEVSSFGFGGEAGLGLYIGASSPVALVPGVRVTAVNTELPGGTLLRMRYVVADVALSIAF